MLIVSDPVVVFIDKLSGSIGDSVKFNGSQKGSKVDLVRFVGDSARSTGDVFVRSISAVDPFDLNILRALCILPFTYEKTKDQTRF